MVPSSRFALSLKPSVEYRALNFCAGWKKQTTLPPLAYAGIPYQSRGERSGTLAMMIAWTRSAMTRSGSSISAIFASTSPSSSALSVPRPRRPAAFTSWARSFMAARSSSVKALLAGFCVFFIAASSAASLLGDHSRRVSRYGGLMPWRLLPDGVGPVLVEEPADFGAALAVFGRPAQEPAMAGRLLHVEFGGHARRAQRPVHADRVRKQPVPGAGGQDRGREAPQVAEQRRDVRVAQVVARRVQQRGRPGAAGQHGVEAEVGLPGVTGPGEVGGRGVEHHRGGQRQALVAGPQDQGRREVPAGRDAPDD